MQKTVYIMCDDCSHEYCVNAIKENDAEETRVISQADLILKHGTLTKYQQTQLEYAKSHGKKVCTIQDLSTALQRGKGLHEKTISFDIEI